MAKKLTLREKELNKALRTVKGCRTLTTYIKTVVDGVLFSVASINARGLLRLATIKHNRATINLRMAKKKEAKLHDELLEQLEANPDAGIRLDAHHRAFAVSDKGETRWFVETIEDDYSKADLRSWVAAKGKELGFEIPSNEELIAMGHCSEVKGSHTVKPLTKTAHEALQRQKMEELDNNGQLVPMVTNFINSLFPDE